VISSIEIGNQFHIIQLKEIQPPFPLIHIPEITESILLTKPITPIIISYENQKLKDLIDGCQPHSSIDLHGKNLNDKDMDIVVKEAIINKKCKKLMLHLNSITSEGASIIAEALYENTTLEQLSLSYNPIGDRGVRNLGMSLSLNNCSVQMLYLISTKITNEGAEYLAGMLKINSRLLRLFLDNNYIGDQGVELLTKTLINHNRTLQRIDLSGNKLISDASVDFLVEILKQIYSFSVLDISDCNLSEQGKDKLRQIATTRIDFNLIL
jgi:Ran GTPase-activating protein (RanGAP) involved in mRNA processing and transport